MRVSAVLRLSAHPSACRTLACMKTIHLTFDDGPHETLTPAVLELLAVHGAKATFFQEGRHVKAFPELSRRVADEGHVVGNHAWDHPDLKDANPNELKRQLSSTSDLLERVIGRRPTHFRPPYGSPLVDEPAHPMVPKILQCAETLGMQTVLWDVSSLD